jgi:hypothetical protein
LTADELQLVDKNPGIDEVLRRPPAEDIKKYLDQLRSGVPSKGEGIDDEIPDEFA